MRLIISKRYIARRENPVIYLSAITGLSKTKIKDAMQKGAVWGSNKGKSKRLRRATRLLEAGSAISLFYDDDILNIKPVEPKLLHESKTFSVWVKPAGIICGGTRFGDHCAINRIVEKKIQKPSFLVHRLDRFTKGLILLAHSKQAARQLSVQFESRAVTKRYEAIAWGQIQKAITINQPIDDRGAITHVTPLKVCGDKSLLSIEIETGRKHQIRKHLAQIGYPVVGDKRYGTDLEENLQLVSVFLEFTDPETTRVVSFELPRPLHLKI